MADREAMDSRAARSSLHWAWGSLPRRHIPMLSHILLFLPCPNTGPHRRPDELTSTHQRYCVQGMRR